MNQLLEYRVKLIDRLEATTEEFHKPVWRLTTPSRLWMRTAGIRIN